MSNKRYSDTINPQIAVQDYLDDLLQKLPATSPLDRLRQQEEDKAATVADKQKAQKSVSKPAHKPESKTRYNPSYRTVGANYSAGRETSLAAQRLEQKRALDRASRRDFREPPTIKPSPLLKAMPEVQSSALDLKTDSPVIREAAVAKKISAEDVESALAEIKVAEETPKNKVAEVPCSVPMQSPLKQPPPDQPTTRQVESAPDNSVAEAKKTASIEKEKHSDEWLENGRPEWAQGRFECLIFTVAGLKLAVPLVSLGAIHTIDQELTPLVGRPDWFLGLLPVGEKNIRVVDSALWIMPERYNESVKDGYRFVIRLDKSEWGMACDSVAQSFSISPEEVRWRTDRGKRPWLAGTVIDHMCALMDVAAVARLLDSAEKTNQSPI
ncbi:chemotaxis protein CheW [Alkalimarinus sediminis]|uniref:Chemotaxis protein CheW n=1 Tax=Alkalimarinus sediminis TaxID=1632866 RepID=A0A9E8HVS9_9ALTE|nr:chemotaxis protein CheW [Alkalimarinus sediminis]UZW76724.1 chemotaxis protein CheW [Alkalimarinus sediminis]